MVSKTTFGYNDEPSQTHSFDTGAAWQNLALEGARRGVVVHGIGRFDHERERDVLSPAMGAIIDRFGRTSLLFASAVLYGLAGGAGYVIDSLYVLLLSRAILDVAVSGIMVTTTTLITDYFSGDQRETVLGW